MSTGKRIGVSILILFALVLLFMVSCVVIMFLAPGTEIFGIRYVSVFSGKFEIDTSIEETFNGDVYIETTDVPITIEFVDYYGASLSFHQNFTGFTKTKISQAGIDYYVKDGDLRIKTTEFIKFIYAQENFDDYHFVLRLPLSAFQSGTRAIYVNSEESSVSTNGGVALKNLDIRTNNSFETTGAIIVNELLKLDLGRSIEIDDKLVCDNLDLTTNGSSVINITRPINGDIKASTKSGNIKFVSCDNLYVKSSSGSVFKYNETPAVVNFNADIDTRSGNVEIAEINALDLLRAGTSKISTKSGNITIGKAKNATISSESGSIYVKEAENLTLSNKIGLTEAKTVTGQLVVDVNNGKVSLGEGGSLKDVTVNNKTGMIYVYNTTGTVDLSSGYNNIEFVNSTSAKITLNAGKKLTAKNLKGDVYAVANGDSYLQFSEISQSVYIEVKNKAKTLDIDATCESVDNISYVLRSTKGERAYVYAGTEKVAENSSISNVRSGQFVITAKSVYAKITLYLGE